jgi:hypothetical protein
MYSSNAFIRRLDVSVVGMHRAFLHTYLFVHTKNSYITHNSKGVAMHICRVLLPCSRQMAAPTSR